MRARSCGIGALNNSLCAWGRGTGKGSGGSPDTGFVSLGFGKVTAAAPNRAVTEFELLPLPKAADRLAASGGASGIIIDNSATTTGASQIYFSTLSNRSSACPTSGGTGGCGVQASQSALQ